MSKTVSLRLSDEVHRQFSEAAKAENRSISNLIQTAALGHLHEQQFVDEYEMAEIRADEELMARLRQGAEEFRGRKGRFVD